MRPRGEANRSRSFYEGDSLTVHERWVSERLSKRPCIKTRILSGSCRCSYSRPAGTHSLAEDSDGRRFAHKSRVRMTAWSHLPKDARPPPVQHWMSTSDVDIQRRHPMSVVSSLAFRTEIIARIPSPPLSVLHDAFGKRAHSVLLTRAIRSPALGRSC